MIGFITIIEKILLVIGIVGGLCYILPLTIIQQLKYMNIKKGFKKD